MWKCKKCGEEILKIWIGGKKYGSYIDKNFNEGIVKKNTTAYINVGYECWNCGNSNKEDFEWIEEESENQ